MRKPEAPISEPAWYEWHKTPCFHISILLLSQHLTPLEPHILIQPISRQKRTGKRYALFIPYVHVKKVCPGDIGLNNQFSISICRTRHWTHEYIQRKSQFLPITGTKNKNSLVQFVSLRTGNLWEKTR